MFFICKKELINFVNCFHISLALRIYDRRATYGQYKRISDSANVHSGMIECHCASCRQYAWIGLTVTASLKPKRTGIRGFVDGT